MNYAIERATQLNLLGAIWQRVNANPPIDPIEYEQLLLILASLARRLCSTEV